MPENFLFETAGLITTITFNRPERRNCMNRDVMLEFEQLILRVRDDRTTRVLIVTGNGTAFSAGADTSGTKGITDPAERARIFATRNRGLPRIIGRVFDTILRLDCMTIGAVNGFAVGGGWALAAAFDFVIASEHAEFWVPEVELGVPFAGGAGGGDGEAVGSMARQGGDDYVPPLQCPRTVRPGIAQQSGEACRTDAGGARICRMSAEVATQGGHRHQARRRRRLRRPAAVLKGNPPAARVRIIAKGPAS